MKARYFVICLLILLIIPVVYAVNYGLAPSSVSINAAKGQEYQKLMRLSSTNNVETKYILSSEGLPEGWVKFYNLDKTVQITEVDVPANSYNELLLMINVPSDAANGIYNAKIKTKSIPDEMQTTGSSVVVEYVSNLKITISGQEDLNGEVRSITIADTESGQPLRIKVHFQNNGNVKARPTIKAEITKDSQVVDNIEFSDAIVDPSQDDIITVEWDTAGRGVGEFSSVVEVYLGTELLEKKFLDFSILERGTLSSEGEVFEVNDPSKISLNKLAKLEVVFYNRGSIDFDAKLAGEIYVDGDLVDTLESEDETTIKVNERKTLSAYFKPTEKGDYVIKRWVSFSGNKVELNDLKFSIGKDGETSLRSSKKKSGANPMIILGVVVVVLLLILLIVLLLAVMLKKSK